LNQKSKQGLLFLKKKKQKDFFFTACVGDSFAKADRNQKFFGYFFSKK